MLYVAKYRTAILHRSKEMFRKKETKTKPQKLDFENLKQNSQTGFHEIIHVFNNLTEVMYRRKIKCVFL